MAGLSGVVLILSLMHVRFVGYVSDLAQSSAFPLTLSPGVHTCKSVTGAIDDGSIPCRRDLGLDVSGGGVKGGTMKEIRLMKNRA